MSNEDVTIGKAHIGDVPGIAALVERYARRSEVLPRPPENIYETLREWVVARRNGEVVGCGSLVILWCDLAEVRSLIVAPELQGQGIGRRIVLALLDEARALQIPRVFALTRKPDFFARLGFERVPRESLPRKMWKDCIHCTKFAGCDEVALVRPVDVSGLAACGGEEAQPTGTAADNGHEPECVALPQAVQALG